MDKVEEYIKNYTRNCSNEATGIQLIDAQGKTIKGYHPWLSPDHARAVAKIAREETISEACEWLYEHLFTCADGARHYVRSSLQMGNHITHTEFMELFIRHFNGIK